MSRIADRFGEAAAACSSIDDLAHLLRDVSRELGFDNFALLHHASLLHPARDYIRIDNYPDAWVSEMIGSGFVHHDPVHQASRFACAGFEWTDIGRLIALRAPEKQILERGRHFGLGEGFTVPVNVPGEPAGSCSFAVRSGKKLPRLRLLLAELIGARAFSAARRLKNFPKVRARPHLSRREVQCLRLVAAGKTDWEIAHILDISVETARQYLKHARSAYDAVTRAQLVALGLRDQWLTFEDAGDPRC